MWLFFFIVAVVGVCVLLFHITLEVNAVEKSWTELMEAMKKHYGFE